MQLFKFVLSAGLSTTNSGTRTSRNCRVLMLDKQKGAAHAELLAALKINPAYYKAKNNLARLDATLE